MSTRQGSTGNNRHDHAFSYLERGTLNTLTSFRLVEKGRLIKVMVDKGQGKGLWQHGSVIFYYKPAFLYAIWIEVSC